MSRPHYEGYSRGFARRAYDSSPERLREDTENEDPYVTPMVYSPRLLHPHLFQNESPVRNHAAHWSYPAHSRARHPDAQPTHGEWSRSTRQGTAEPPIEPWNTRRRPDPIRPMSVPPPSFYPPPNVLPGFPPMFAFRDPRHHAPPPRGFPTFLGGPPGFAPPFNPIWTASMYASRRDLPYANTPPRTDPLRARDPSHLSPTTILWPVEDWPPAENRRGIELILYQLLLATSGHPIMKWNMKDFPESLHRWSPRGLHVAITKDNLSAPVSHPPLNKMQITIEDSPFAPIVISKSEPLTLRNVLDAIFDHLHTVIPPDQYDMMDSLKRVRVKQAFYRRCEEGNLGLPEYERRRGVKRIDWFEGNSTFGGLEEAHVAPTGELCCTLAVLP